MYEKNIINLNQAMKVCAFQNWFHDFEKISISSTFIKIPADVVNYLLDEIIILPKECTLSYSSSDGWNDEDTEDSEVLV